MRSSLFAASSSISLRFWRRRTNRRKNCRRPFSLIAKPNHHRPWWHGVAAVLDSGRDGPTVLFRAELDALPIPEETGLDWTSTTEGKGHLCGHDGYMTILLALGRLLSRQPIQQGRVVLMFQPAEEDGSGARLVVADPESF